jgi:predicted PurR-regulated permease PerM
MSVGYAIVSSLGAWLKAQAQNAVIVTGLYIVAFAMVGVPWWLLAGLLSGLVNLVPHLGPVLALAIPLPLIWIASYDWIRLAYVGGAWLAIQIVDGFFLSPRAAGRAGVNPFVAILITIVAGFLFGPVGLLVAVPVVAVVMVVVRALRSRGDYDGHALR